MCPPPRHHELTRPRLRSFRPPDRPAHRRLPCDDHRVRVHLVRCNDACQGGRAPHHAPSPPQGGQGAPSAPPVAPPGRPPAAARGAPQTASILIMHIYSRGACMPTRVLGNARADSRCGPRRNPALEDWPRARIQHTKNTAALRRVSCSAPSSPHAPAAPPGAVPLPSLPRGVARAR